MYKIVSQTALLEFAWNYYVKVVQKTWAKRKNGKKKGLGVGDIIPRAEVGKSTGCRRLSRLYRCLIGMGGRYEAG